VRRWRKEEGEERRGRVECEGSKESGRVSRLRRPRSGWRSGGGEVDIRRGWGRRGLVARVDVWLSTVFVGISRTWGACQRVWRVR
jgi:hypothetical protein